MLRNNLRRSGIVAFALAALTAAAHTQNSTLPGVASANPACQRLESQLNAIDRGPTGDSARIEQTRRYEDAANKQQHELDRVVMQSRRLGCGGNGFFLFGGQPQQCGPLNTQIQQMRANLDRILTDLQRLQNPVPSASDGQRRAVLAALAQNDCGPQYRGAVQAAAPPPQPRGLFDTLFGRNSVFGGNANSGGTPEVGGGGYRTLCVRTCDGFYWPISFSTSASRFADDERVCQRMCPEAEVVLYSHRNPGEDVAQAVSISGRLYSELPNAFRYRKTYDPSCSCRKPGESWAEALKATGDQTVERGDIIVTEERAKALAVPKDAKGRPIKLPAQPASANAGQPAASEPPPADAAASDPDAPKKPVRTVGPRFLPVR
jgi:hypothetical protein